MKRFHVHIGVDDLQQNIRFYSALFGVQPATIEDDYAKWILDDPCVNFAISSRGQKPGLDHVGFQAESGEELQQLESRMKDNGIALMSQTETDCCYTRSDKHWTIDPQGIPWETFYSMQRVSTFQGKETRNDNPASCCAPTGGECCS